MYSGRLSAVRKLTPISRGAISLHVDEQFLEFPGLGLLYCERGGVDLMGLKPNP